VLISSPDQLADSIVTNPKLAASAVTNSKLSDNAISARTLSGGAVGNAKLATRAVDERTLASAAVGNFNLQDGAVTNSKLVSPVYSASVAADGTSRTSSTVGVSKTAQSCGRPICTGLYDVTFIEHVDKCAIVASTRGFGFTAEVRGPTSSDGRTVLVATRQPKLNSGGTAVVMDLIDTAFDVIAQC
jgi:hypothetical protein